MQLQPVRVERRARLGLDPPELLAVGVTRQHGELRLRVAQRHLLTLECDPRREQSVLQLVLPLRELRGGEAAFAGLAQTVEALGVVACRLLGLAERPRAAHG